MKIVTTAKTDDGSPQGRPIGTEIEHPDAWWLCILQPPVAEPVDDEAKEIVAVKRAEQHARDEKIRANLRKASEAANALAAEDAAREEQMRHEEFERTLLE